MPSDLVILGFKAVLKAVSLYNEELLTKPDFYKTDIQSIDLQLTTLTEAMAASQIEAKYTFVVGGVIGRLKGKPERIPQLPNN